MWSQIRSFSRHVWTRLLMEYWQKSEAQKTAGVSEWSMCVGLLSQPSLSAVCMSLTCLNYSNRAQKQLQIQPMYVYKQYIPSAHLSSYKTSQHSALYKPKTWCKDGFHLCVLTWGRSWASSRIVELLRSSELLNCLCLRCKTQSLRL